MRLTMLRTLRRSSKKKLFIIPFLFTFANAMWGFLSIIHALEGRYGAAALCIFFAALMDAIDGRLARALGSTSLLGMELDSLCDAISFCVAPAILMYCWQLHTLGFVGKGAVLIYVMCGLFRLAKFNTMQGTPSNFFIGLPTPGAALTIATLLIHQNGVMVPPYASFAICLILALLMISPIRFFAGKNLKGLRMYALGLCGIVLIGIGTFYGYPMFLMSCSAYIIMHCVVYFLKILFPNAHYSKNF